MAKAINTNSENIKKAVDQYGQDKVNAVLAKQQAQGATITNETTQKTVEPAPAPTPAPTPVEPPVQTTPPAPTTVESIRAARQKVSSSTPIVKEAEANIVSTEEAQTQGDAILPESVTGIKPVTPEPLKVAPQTNEDGTTTTEPVVPVTETTTTKTEVPVKNDFVPQNEDEAFQVLQKGGTLTKTVDNAKFTARYNAYQKINAMPAQSIADMNVAGLIDQKTMDRLAQLNPQKWAEVNKLTDNGIKIDTINQASERLYNNSQGQKNVVESKSEQIINDIINGLESGDGKLKGLYERLANGELSDLTIDIAEQDAAIEDMQDEMDKVYEDITGEYSTLPRSMRLGMAAAATKDLNRQLTTMIRARNVTFATYNAKKEDLDAEIEYERDQQNKRDERKFQLQTILYGDKKEEEINLRELAEAEDVLNESRQYDEETKKEARLQLYQDAITKLGLKPIEGADIDTLMNQFAGGMKEATTYERKLAADALKDKDRLSASDFLEMDGYDADGNPVKVYRNLRTGEVLSANEYSNQTTPTTNLSVLPDSFSGRTKATQNVGVIKNDDNSITIDLPEGTKAGQCAFFANDYGDELPGYKHSGNEWSTKQVNINSKTPVAGGLFMYTPGKAEAGYGHIGIVEKVNADGSIQVYDSNFNGDQLTTRRTIPVGSGEYKLLTEGDKSKGGFFAPTGSQSAPQPPKATVDVELKNNLSDIIDFSGLAVSSKDSLKKSLDRYVKSGNTEGIKNILNMNFEDVVLTGPNKTKYQEDQQIMSQIDTLEEGINRFIKNGGDLNWLSGTKEQYTQKITKNTKDPDLAALGVAMADILDSFARGRTGAVINAEETIAFGKIIPTLGDTPELINAKIEGFKNNVTAKTEKYKQTKIKERLGSNYSKVYGEEEVPQSKEENQADINELLKTMSKEEVYDLLVAEGLNPTDYNLGTAQRGASGKY